MNVDLDLLNTILDSVDSATATWTVTLLPIGLQLFWGLAAIEFAWTWIAALTPVRGDLPNVFFLLARKLLYIAVLAYVVSEGPSIFHLIISSFQQAGATAADIPDLRPSTFLNTGAILSVHVLTSLDAIGFLFDPLGRSMALVGSFGIFLCYAFMSFSLTLTLVETLIVGGSSYFLLAFGASRWTCQLADGALATAFRCGVKLLLTYLLAGIIQGLSIQWGLVLQTSAVVGPYEYFVFLGTAGTAALLLWTVPRLAAQLVPPSIHIFNPRIAD
jgi:type IV secretion system protein TrbL